MRKLPRPPAPVTDDERREAAAAVIAIRRALAEPGTSGKRTRAHVNYGRRRNGVRGAWVTWWENLPGLSHSTAEGWSHRLLSDWVYTTAEMRTEMLDDLQRIAEQGVRPTTSTASPPSSQPRLL